MRAGVEITIRRLEQSRRLASLTVGLDMTTKLVHRVPPPILWAQNPCFLEVARRVALQNIENNEVPCKIFQAKELRAVSASFGRFRIEGGAKRTYRDDLRESFWDHCATKRGNNLQAPAVRPIARYSLAKAGVRGLPGPQLRGTWGTRLCAVAPAAQAQSGIPDAPTPTPLPEP